MSDAGEPGKLSDANKESVKELLSTFRALFALDVSGLALVIPLRLRGEIGLTKPSLFLLAVSCGVAAALLMVYLFLLALQKIHRAEPSIIFQRPIVFSSVGAVAFLLAAVVLMIIAA